MSTVHASDNVAICVEKQGIRDGEGRAAVEIDARTVEELARLKDPLGRKPAEDGMIPG